MKVIIDNNLDDSIPGTINTFKELMDYLESEVVFFPRIITRVILNEDEIDESQEIGLGAFSVKDIEVLEIQTDNLIDLAYQALEDSQDYLPVFAVLFEQAAKDIREGNVKKGISDASEGLEVVSAFGQILDNLRGAFQIDFSLIQIDDLNLLDKLIELNGFAQRLLKAIQDEDWTLFADILEYDLSPLLYEWMAVIPELVKLLPGEDEG